MNLLSCEGKNDPRRSERDVGCVQHQDHMVRAVRWTRTSGKRMSHGDEQRARHCHELARGRVDDSATTSEQNFVTDEFLFSVVVVSVVVGLPDE